MGNYTPGIIKARGGPPRGLIFNLRGYRVPWSLRRGLVAGPRRCTTFRRIEFYGVSRRFLAAFMGVKFVRFWPLHGFFYGCPTFHGFLTASRPICAASVRVQTALKPLHGFTSWARFSLFALCSPFVRWCFSRGSLGVHGARSSGVRREFMGPASGRPGLGFWAV